MSVARLNDPTSCGQIIGSVSGTTYADGIPVALLGSDTSCPCNAPNPPAFSTIIAAVASAMFADGIPVAILGSQDGCPATVVAASATTGAI